LVLQVARGRARRPKNTPPDRSWNCGRPERYPVRAVVGLRREINVNDIRVRRESIRLADLSRHFQQRELADRNPRIAYSTKKGYAGYLEKWIEPRWGEYSLLEIRAVEVESWLKSLNRAPRTRCKIRNVMSLLFNHGRRHELCDRNPIQWVRQSAKRRATPDILTRDEVQGLLASLRFRERTLVLLAVTTGLRRSELFALKWKDVDLHSRKCSIFAWDRGPEQVSASFPSCRYQQRSARRSALRKSVGNSLKINGGDDET
jgi:integrase